MVKVRFKYSNGHYEIYEFNSVRDANEFANQSEDLITEIQLLGKKNNEPTKRFMEL